MALRARLAELGRYGGVGLLAAALHALILLGGEGLGAPLPLANLLGFLTASLWGYLAHALFTFREQTGGVPFPRRWLLIQTSLNVLVSLLLPLGLGAWAPTAAGTVVMVFTPTAINYVVWSLAARHSRSRRRRQQQAASQPLRFHADDLGLHPAVNRAIFTLHDAGVLDSASVLVTAPALEPARQACQQRPRLELALHLCLSEGLPAADPALIPDLLDGQGRLAVGFGRLLLQGLMPPIWPQRRRLARQLALEIGAQLDAFQRMFPGRPLRLDGHQHLHLLPLVWDQLRQLPPAQSPVWIRSLRESWPWQGIPLPLWWHTLKGLGPLKWLLLQGLNLGRAAELRRRGIATNAGFSGVLFSGCMEAAVLAAAERQLVGCGGLVLAHPCLERLNANDLPAYPLSGRFYASPWRQREAEALMRRTR